VNIREVKPEPSLATRVSTVFGLADQLLGIGRGEVVFHVADAKFADVDGTQELLDGFAVSQGSKDGDQELHVLLTNQIADNGEPFALGIAPGIPGAATVYGRNVSGIVVASGQSSDEDALTMLHEAGHFIGLNHTTELDGASSDPFTDTPKCPAISGGQNMWSCPDRANVMFPAGAIDRPVALSANQKRVHRGSPVDKANANANQKTLSAKAPLVLEARSFHTSGRALSALESQLSLGAGGLSRIDANALGEP
jgi:hypothetical protein